MVRPTMYNALNKDDLHELINVYVDYLESRVEMLVDEKAELEKRLNDPMIIASSYESLKSWK